MKKVSILALILALSMAFTGCTNSEIKLYNAFKKSQDIMSMESDTNLTFKVEAKNFPAEQQQTIEEISKMLNNSEFKMYQRTVQNEEKTIAKSYVNTDFNLGDMKMDMQVWVEADMSTDTPKLVEIIKLPSAMMSTMAPEGENKEFIVYDFAEMMNTGKEGVNLDKLTDFSKEIQPKLMNLLKDYYTKFDPGFEVGAFKGTRTVNGRSLSIYEVKLDDASFKKLVRYAGNSYLEDENTINFIKEYFNGVMGAIDGTDEEKQELSQNLDKFQQDLPQIKKQFNEFMDKFEDVKILGDKGLVIEYGINSDGYIAHEAGKMDLSIDLGAIEKAFKNSDIVESDAVEQETPVLNIEINFNTKIYNINKDIIVNMPKVDNNNALYFSDLVQNNLAQ
ncbi:hypothetical protein KQI42_12880 [Tissierella sp. MSJ-40]|uniref:Lipoprotein n=1 Tax=Tissierella simiarum TaxID=2841534 RepID=A0ABS6E7M1_9FIRM|nr:hypothetical protein [Tissierella simiarum]MBU5438914.1 hypothetical protein [Tissierella simiarum]